MRHWLAATLLVCATGAQADVTCQLDPVQADDPSTLLVRDVAPDREAVILVTGRTLVFDCPERDGVPGIECYGQTAAPLHAPAQLNVAADPIVPGTIVVVTTRNMFFGKNAHIGYHRRHSSVRIYTVAGCETT